MRVCNLRGAKLDYWVRKTLFVSGDILLPEGVWSPSTNWAEGGRLLDRERISVVWQGAMWRAHNEKGDSAYGDTMLEAGMRCIVASRYGSEVEVP